MGWGMWIYFLVFIGCGWFFLMWWPRQYRYNPYQRSEEDPLEVARMRLAKGEITPEEYEKIRKTIDS